MNDESYLIPPGDGETPDLDLVLVDAPVRPTTRQLALKAATGHYLEEGDVARLAEAYLALTEPEPES